MLKLVCDGCMLTEEKRDKIEEVELIVSAGTHRGGVISVRTDLCPSCMTAMLQTYFRGERPKGSNQPPKVILEPTLRERLALSQ